MRNEYKLLLDYVIATNCPVTKELLNISRKDRFFFERKN
jgi:hypothetical protein